jgi:2-keto-4-pentenoate hydratase/2-oxohepta-3-ene-1,7-dioic acid hydratase in catechol pathway
MAKDYRLLTYREGTGAPQAGVLVEERVHPAARLIEGGGIDAHSVFGLLQSWDAAKAQLDKAVANLKPGDGKALAEVQLQAPILYPGALFCAGANYWDHAKEMAEREARMSGKPAQPVVKVGDPWFFIKTAAHSIIGPGAPARLPAVSKAIDWEAELGVVIGKSGRNIPLDRAFDIVAGYTIVNDLSARDLGTRKERAGGPFFWDWIGQKCFEDAAPMGPWITPASFVRDPSNLSIKLWVNDELKQNSNTSQLIHGIAEQITYLSQHVTLRPGDVIATGTPAGVGAPHNTFLKVGDTVKIEIEGLGTLTNKMVQGV